VIITILPSAIVYAGGGGQVAAMLTGAGTEVASPLGLALVLAGGLALGLVLERLRVAAPILLGATVVSTALHASGLTASTVPPLLATAGLVLIGVFIAERFRTLDPAVLLRTLPAAAAPSSSATRSPLRSRFWPPGSPGSPCRTRWSRLRREASRP
jgi:hypothetical protein